MTTVTVEKIQPNPKSGATRAFVTFTANGIRVVDARIVEGSKGMFLALPQKSWETHQGEKKYSNIIEITDEDLKAEIERQVVAAWRRQQ
jgi:DNA-binding cell septation regulator SpoVG